MKRIFMIFSILLFVFTLAACNDIIPERELKIEAVRVQGSTVEDVYVLDDFDLSSIKLELLMEDESVQYKQLTESMIDEDDVSKLETLGEHTINVSHRTFETNFTLNLVEDTTERVIYQIYQLGVSDGSIEEGYDTWKASIAGDDGREIELGVHDDAISWRYTDEVEWQSLIEIAELKVDIDEDDEEYLVQFFAADKLIGLYIVEKGASLIGPTYTKEGHTFVEWDTDLSSIDDHLVVQGVYDVNQYTISFESEHGTFSDITLEYGEVLNLPVPDVSDDVFLGWYYDNSYGRIFNEGTMPAKDVTLFAQFISMSSEDDLSPDIEAMIETVSDGIIGIRNIQNDQIAGTGSGVIYKQVGDIYYAFTNEHVIEGATRIDVVFEKNGNQFIIEDVTLVADYKGADIAVITFQSSLDFETLSFGDSNALRKAQTVYAIGSPQGFTFFNSITTGIISNLDVRVTGSGGEIDANFIQHDAAINPGNSGGALINTAGEIIGLNTLKIVSEDVEGMGFALPSNVIERMVNELEEVGTITRVEFGASFNDLTNCDAYSGVCLGNISNNNTADNLGLIAGDLVLGIKTQSMNEYLTVYNRDQFKTILLSLRVGDEISIRYERNGDIVETSFEPLT